MRARQRERRKSLERTRQGWRLSTLCVLFFPFARKFSNSLFLLRAFQNSLFLFLFLSRARFFLKGALFFTSIRVEIALFSPHSRFTPLFSLFCSVVLRSVGFWEEIARPRALEHNLWPRRSQDKSRTENVENRRDVYEKNWSRFNDAKLKLSHWNQSIGCRI